MHLGHFRKCSSTSLNTPLKKEFYKDYKVFNDENYMDKDCMEYKDKDVYIWIMVYFLNTNLAVFC